VISASQVEQLMDSLQHIVATDDDDEVQLATWLCSSDEDDDDDRTAQAMQNRRSNVGLMSGQVRSVMQQFQNRRFQRWSRRYFHSTVIYAYLREISSMFLGARVGVYPASSFLCLLL